MENDIKTIGKDYNLWQLFKFCISPMITQMLLSLLMSLDDSLFISRYVGTDALAAFSVLWPAFMLMDAVPSILIGVSTFCSAKMGEKKYQEASNAFATIAVVCVVVGFSLSIIVRTLMDPILNLLGATEKLYPLCKLQYTRQCWFFAFSYLSQLFSNFYVVAGKPKFSTITTLMSAGVNVLFDYIFVVRMGLSMAGTAYANALGHVSNIIFGLIFFSSRNCEIKLGKPNTNLKELLPPIVKLGIPRMTTSMSLSINSIIAHRILLDIVNETALSANSIVNSLQFIFLAAYFGLIDTASPIVSYAYGEKNKEKLSRSIKQIFILVCGATILAVTCFMIFVKPISTLYITDLSDPLLEQLMNDGLRVAPLGFFWFGFAVYTQAMFSCVQNSKVATILTIFENLIFSNLVVFILPYLFGIDGYWFVMTVSEFLTCLVSFFYIYKYRNHYGYGPSKKAIAIG